MRGTPWYVHRCVRGTPWYVHRCVRGYTYGTPVGMRGYTYGTPVGMRGSYPGGYERGGYPGGYERGGYPAYGTPYPWWPYYPGIYTLGIPPWVHHRPALLPILEQQRGADGGVRDSEALGSSLGIIREMRRI